jgi:hypothetical protein
MGYQSFPPVAKTAIELVGSALGLKLEARVVPIAEHIRGVSLCPFSSLCKNFPWERFQMEP